MKKRTLILIAAVFAVSQFSFAQNADYSPLNSVVTVNVVVDGSESRSGSGVVVGIDGFILTPLHLVKNGREISVKLRNGEIYDNAKIVKSDERRNVALLQIIAGKLVPITALSAGEPIVGTSVSIISNSFGTAVTKEAKLSGIQMADGIAGAGTGYRVVLFDANTSDDLAGGLLLGDGGQPVGIVTTNPNVRQANIAVPFSSISGLFPASNRTPVETKTANSATKTAQTEKSPVDPEWTKAHKVLHTAQTIYVHSKTSFIQDPAFIAELMKNPDFTEWGWSFTNDRETADLVLEVERLPWVIKFAFKVYSIKHGVIIASGNKHTNDLNYGSPDLVREIIRRIKIEWMMSK